MDLSKFLRQNYPEDTFESISSDLYPPPAHAVLIAQLASYLWLVGIFLLLGGSKILGFLQLPMPDILKQAENNKMVVFLGLFMINNVANSMLATGAFEVFVDDELIFSKLQMNRFPTAQDIIQGLSMQGLLPMEGR